MLNVKDVFLDQNHWIYLSSAYYGKPRMPEHVDVLDALCSAVRSGKVRLPIDFLHLVELLRAADTGRRERLAAFLDELCGGWFLARWSHILPHEIDLAIALMLGASAPEKPKVVGKGYLFGLGSSDRAEFKQDFSPESLDVITQLAERPGALVELVTPTENSGRTVLNEAIATSNLKDAEAVELERSSLRNSSREMQKRIKMLKYTMELQTLVGHALSPYGQTFVDFLSRGPEAVAEFWSGVPSLNVDCQLTLYRDRQRSRAMSPNDFADLGHLALAVPYCSIVVTEKFWARAVEETKVARDYGTQVFGSLQQLLPVLEA